MLIEHVNLFFKNYMFKFINECLVILFIIIINFLFHAILTRNDFKETIQLFRKLQIKSIMNLKVDDYYYVNDFKKV